MVSPIDRLARLEHIGPFLRDPVRANARGARYQRCLYLVLGTHEEHEVAATHETISIEVKSLQGAIQWLESVLSAQVCHGIDEVFEENSAFVASVVECEHAVT